MKDVFARLGADFFSTIVFLVLYFATDNVVLATSVAIVTETIPEYVTIAGYAWAALMFALGAGVIAVASTGDIKLWAFYVSVVAIGAKVAAFAVQYVAFRLLVTSRIRSI